MRYLKRHPKNADLYYFRRITDPALLPFFDGKKTFWRVVGTGRDQTDRWHAAHTEFQARLKHAKKEVAWNDPTPEMLRSLFVNRERMQRETEAQPDYIVGATADGDAITKIEHDAARAARQKVEQWVKDGAQLEAWHGLANSPRLSVALDAFLKERPNMSRSTADDLRTYCRRLQEVIGGDLPIGAVTKQHMIHLKTLLPQMPSRLKLAERKQPMQTVIANADPSRPRMTLTTVEKWFQLLGPLFGWAVDHEYAQTNPCTGLKPKRSKKRAGPKTRGVEFDDDDIAALFTALPQFVRPNRPADKWLPILALFQGARLGELGQLLVDDVKTDKRTGITYLNLDYLDDEAVSNKSFKTLGSARRVPLHPVLKEIGFLDHVAAQRAAGEMHLFPDLPHGNPKYSSTHKWSNWINDDVIHVVIADRRKTFHSMRHCFKTACRGRVDREVHDVITGHCDPAVSADYGSTKLDVMEEAVSHVRYPTFPKALYLTGR